MGRKCKRVLSILAVLAMLMQMAALVPAEPVTAAAQAADVVIDFSIGASKKYKELTIADDGWEVNMTESAAELASLLDGGSNHYWYRQIPGFLAYMHQSKKMVIDFHVDATGYYDVAIDVSGNNNYVAGAKFSVVSPADSTTAQEIVTLNNSFFTTGNSGSWVNMNAGVTLPSVLLHEGTNRLVIEGTSTYSTFLALRSITFTPAQPKTEIIDFSVGASKAYRDLDIDTDGWEFNLDASATEFADKLENDTSPWHDWYGALGGFAVQLRNSKKIAIDFTVAAAGSYNISIAGAGAINQVNGINVSVVSPAEGGTSTLAGVLNNSKITGAFNAYYNIIDEDLGFETVYLTSGTNRIIFEVNTTSSNTLAFESISFTPRAAEKLTIDSSDITVKKGQTVTGTVAVKNSQGEDADLTGGQVVSVKADSTMANISFEIKDGKLVYTIKGLVRGETQVELEIKGAEDSAGEATIKVITALGEKKSPRNLIFDFIKSYKSGTGTDYIDSVTYEMNTQGSADEMNISVSSEPWAFYKKGTWFRYVDGFEHSGLQNYPLGSTNYIKIKVEEPGTYYPVAVFGSRIDYSKALADAALYKIEDNQLVELASVKGVNTTIVHTGVRARLSDQPLELEAGEYVVSWTVADRAPGTSSSDTAVVYLRGFELLLEEHGKVLETQTGSAGNLEYDFTVGYDAQDKTQEQAEEISWQDTVDAGSDPWMLYSYYKLSAPYTVDAFTYAEEGKGLLLKAHSGAIKIHVPVSGYYIPTFNTSALSGTGTLWAYFMKLKADGSVDSQLAYKSLSLTTAAADYRFKEYPIYMEAGEYLVYARNISGSGAYFNSLKLSGYNRVLDTEFTEIAVKTGETVNEYMAVTDADGSPVDLTGGEVYAEVADTSVANMSLSIEDGKVKYQIYGRERGVTTANISIVAADGRAAIQEIKICINPEGIIVGEDEHYDFRKAEGTEITQVTDFAMTTAGDAAEINPDSTYSTDPWKYISHSAKFFEYQDSANGIFLGETTASASFGIEVTENGVYQPVSINTLQPNGAAVKVFIAPEGAEDPTAEEYSVGSIDTYSYTRTVAQESPLHITNLESGRYIVTYVLDGKGENVAVDATRFDFTGLTLKAMDAYSDLSITVDAPATLNAGESVEIPVIVEEDNSESVWTPAVDMTVECSVDDVTCEIISNADKTQHTLKVTAAANAAAANVMITVTARNESGIAKAISIPMLILNPSQTADRTYQFMFLNAMKLNDQVRVMDSYSKTLPGSPDEVRPGSGTDNWKYHSNTASSFWYFSDTHGVSIGTGLNTYGAITVRLPSGGIFRPVMQYTAGNTMGIIRMYIAPVDAEDPRDEKWAVGELDTYSAASSKVQHGIFRTRYMDAGEYVVTWQIIGNNKLNEDTPRLWVGGLRLEPVSEYPEITAAASAEVNVKKGGSAAISVAFELNDATAGSSRVLSDEAMIGGEFEIISDHKDFVSVQAEYDPRTGNTDLTLSGLKEGQADVEIGVNLFGVRRASFTLPVTVSGVAEFESVKVKFSGTEQNGINIRDAGTDAARLETTLYAADGSQILPAGIQALGGAAYSYTSSDESIATVSRDGHVMPVAIGDTTITCTVTLAGVTKSVDFAISVKSGKTKATYFTAEKVAAARENAEKYDFARDRQRAAIDAAEVYLKDDMVDMLWDRVTTQELPRAYYVGYRGDPDAVDAKCRYCGTVLSKTTGDRYGGYIIDIINAPWKIQCPECRRRFPSNDFSKFWDAGIDEYGNWRYELAKQNGSQYLTNDLYPEKGAGWGVDDGYGYVTGRKSASGVAEVHTYIAFYNHWGIWMADSNNVSIHEAIEALTEAYMMTGDVRYGRIGAILLDRIGDIYPDMDTNCYRAFMTDASTYDPPGKIHDYVWENALATKFAKAYDVFYEMYDDPYVVNYISTKAKQWNYFGRENKKETPNQIRQHCEDNVLREIIKALKNGNINGNFCVPQTNAALTAVVLDTYPESQDLIDWVFRTSDASNQFLARDITGGSVEAKLIRDIDRDGMTNEISPSYSNMWIENMTNLVYYLSDYEGYPSKDLYKNPKWVKGIYSTLPLTLSNGATAQIGDSGDCAGSSRYLNTYALVDAWKKTRMPIFAQMLYYTNGNSEEGLTYDIFSENPESLEGEVRQAIETYGELNLGSSELLPAYGFAILRDGEMHESVVQSHAYNSKRNFWIHFGRTGIHSHKDALNLGVEAFGLNLAPEGGYPQAVTGYRYTNFDMSTLNHNTVVVDDSTQGASAGSALPHHFDDADMVKLMDVENKQVYPQLDEYRRTVVMIDVDDEISYGVDFFRVVGGKQHVYSFHTMSEGLAAENGSEGLTFVAQKKDGEYVGSYAGADVPYETPGNYNGYSFLNNVDRAVDPGTGEFSLDFQIKDFRGQLAPGRDIHLRMNMLNDKPVSEVALADGRPALYNDNPDMLKFMMVRSSGPETLFTNVIEPYEDERYISDTVQLPREQITYADGSAIAADDVIKVVKVVFASGSRTDYIIYSRNQANEYKITDGQVEIPFNGFVGVYIVDGNNTPTYSYVNDGTRIGELETKAAYSGVVTDFTKTLEYNNYITVKFNEEVNTQDIIGRYMYIEGEGYQIMGAGEQQEDGSIELDVGDNTTISNINEYDEYSYFIDIDDNVYIPLSAVVDSSPVFAPMVDKYDVVAGYEFTASVSAASPVDKELTYSAVSLPRGASFDPETGRISWTPDSRQIGKHHIAIKADDGSLSSIVHLELEVYKSSSGSNSVATLTPGAGTVSGGSGAQTDTSGESGESTGNTGVSAPDTPSERFIDLGGYAWAKDAIYRLVDKGVVNGTSENTYSPAANIKRADFAIMLVRAFGITEGEGENFVDVDPNKYYAEELRAARVSGIVNGIGENKFNPEGEITRQDMMLMLARALDAVGYELSEADRSVLAQFADAADISDYAADAVSRVVKDGIIAGSNGRIDPLKNATRAEIAVMLDRVLAE